MNTNNNNIPNYIQPSEELINKMIELSSSAFGIIPSHSSLKTEVFNLISKIESIVIHYITDILVEFPLLSELQSYISDEIEILIDRSKYFTSLGEINRTIKDVEFIIDNYSLLFQNTIDPNILKSLYKSVLGRVCSTLRSKEKSVSYLNHCIQAFHSIPVVQDYLSTCIILGNKTDDLFFSIIMGSDNSTNNNEENEIIGLPQPEKNEEDEDFQSNDSDDEEYEDDDELKGGSQQGSVIRSYKFNDNINYNLKNEEWDNANNGGGPLDQFTHKPFSVGLVGKFQIIETPSLSLMNSTNNSAILIDMVKSMLKHVNGLLLFNIDFQVNSISELEQQITYYSVVKQIATTSQIILIFTNCKSNSDSLNFIEFFKSKVNGNGSNDENDQHVIPPIFIYEQHQSSIKEYILRYNNFPPSPFSNNNLNNMFDSLTVGQQQQQNQLMLLSINNRPQQQEDIDFDILDKINKLDINL